MDRQERAAKISELLADHKMTCHTLSAAMGNKVSKQTLYLILRCRVSPSCDTVIKLEDHFKLQRGELL